MIKVTIMVGSVHAMDPIMILLEELEKDQHLGIWKFPNMNLLIQIQLKLDKEKNEWSRLQTKIKSRAMDSAISSLILHERIHDNEEHKGTFLQLLQKSRQSCKKVLGDLQKSLRKGACTWKKSRRADSLARRPTDGIFVECQIRGKCNKSTVFEEKMMNFIHDFWPKTAQFQNRNCQNW